MGRGGWTGAFENVLVRHDPFLLFVTLEIVFTIAAPDFDILFIGCVLNRKIVYTTAEKLTFEAF